MTLLPKIEKIKWQKKSLFYSLQLQGLWLVINHGIVHASAAA
jgi:hypothetical protein